MFQGCGIPNFGRDYVSGLGGYRALPLICNVLCLELGHWTVGLGVYMLWSSFLDLCWTWCWSLWMFSFDLCWVFSLSEVWNKSDCYSASVPKQDPNRHKFQNNTITVLVTFSITISTKHNMQIIKLQNNTQTTVKNDEKWDRKLRTKSKILTCFGLSRVVHMSNAWKNVGFRSIALKK